MRVMATGLPASNVNSAAAGAQIFPSTANLLLAASLQVPGSGRMSGKRVVVRASGYATTIAATTTAQITLYAIKNGALAAGAAPLTPGSYTVLLAGTARVINTTSAPWSYEARLSWDNVGKKVQGVAECMVNNLYDAPAALTNVLAIDDAGNEPPFTLVVGITFAVNLSASNVGSLSEFSLGF